MMMTSIISEESLVRDTQTERHSQVYAKFFKVAYEKQQQSTHSTFPKQTTPLFQKQTNNQQLHVIHYGSMTCIMQARNPVNLQFKMTNMKRTDTSV